MVKSPLTIAGAILLAASAAGYAQTSTSIYSYTVPANGYAPNGTLSAYTDSVTGTWAMQYDNVNRLQNAAASAGPYQGVNLQWGFDSFGNRTSQIPSGTSNASLPGPSSPSYNANNRVVSGNGSFTPTYDAAGNMTFDGAATYTAYDGDNRVCATYSTIGGSGVTQYIYNAEGQRVAKGHPVSSPGNTPFCPTDMANFVADSKYVLGPSGEQMTEVDGSGTWRHTNVYNGGQMLATYDTHGLHFPQTDPLGTVRVQATATGAAEETCASLPFGDGLNCTPAISEPTEHHFTGKERDTESGLDYFGARYYASSMGRWMSPDWADKPEAVPYSSLDNPQTLNLYGYVGDNPLSHADPDGHCDANGQNCSVWDHVAGAIGGALNIVPMTLNVPNQIFNAVSGAFGGPQVTELPMIQTDTHASEGGVMVGTAAAAAAPMAAAAAEVKTAGMVVGEARAATAAESVPESIPAGPGARPSPSQQNAINQMGGARGCSTCGATSPGTKTGNWVGDHQPPTKLNSTGGPQVYKPQCIQCSRQQGGQVSAAVKAAKKTEAPQW